MAAAEAILVLNRWNKKSGMILCNELKTEKRRLIA